MVYAPVRRDIARGLSTVQVHKPCSMISSVDLVHYGVSCAKDLRSVDCGTKTDHPVIQ